MNTLADHLGSGCARTWRERPYREALALRDGRRATLRPMHHGDGAALHGLFFERMSPRSRLLRFHGVVNDLPADMLRAMTLQVPGRKVVLTALGHSDDGLAPLVAEARYVVDDRGEAEFALAVADAWQGQGLGQALLRRLAAHARSQGLHQLRGSVLPGNTPMLRLADALGAEACGHAPEVLVRLPL